jgi:hypothetical protein
MASQSGNAPRQGKIEAHQLAPVFPAAVGAWKREQLASPLPQPVPVPRPAMRALYSQGDQRAEITVHAGKASGAAKGTRSVYSEVRPAKPDTLVTITLANGLQFAATSRTADAPALEALLRGLDLDRAETLAPARR